jgi:hypothetical protein
MVRGAVVTAGQSLQRVESGKWKAGLEGVKVNALIMCWTGYKPAIYLYLNLTFIL